jgi:hypothetical protein
MTNIPSSMLDSSSRLIPDFLRYWQSELSLAPNVPTDGFLTTGSKAMFVDAEEDAPLQE